MPTKIIPIEVLNQRKPCESILTAIKYIDKSVSKSGVTRSRIECLCECGNIKNAVVADFLRGNPKSCGCAPNKSKYKHRNKRLYQTWKDMLYRCNNKLNKYYGAKGVQVCSQWSDYDTFAEWSINNGYTDLKQIDKDIKGNGMLYSPESCTWVTAKQNQDEKNTRLGIVKRNNKTGRFAS